VTFGVTAFDLLDLEHAVKLKPAIAMTATAATERMWAPAMMSSPAANGFGIVGLAERVRYPQSIA
jgi:hypothetical protein